MRFDSNLAWRQAVAMVSANREVLLVIAGVFFFLPKVIATYAFGGMQATMMAQMAQHNAMSDPQAVARLMNATFGHIFPALFALLLVEAVGYMAMIALLTDSRRPTVGEAIVGALKSLPTLIGVMLLMMAAYLLTALVLGLVLGLAYALTHSRVVLGIGVVAIIAFVLVALTRLSLVFPVIVIDGVRGPWPALARAWRLVRGNTGRLFGFYVLLFIAYVVIALVITLALSALMNVALGHGEGAMLGMGIVSGVIGGLASILFTAILVAVHRQLAGPSMRSVAATFE